MGTLTEHVKAEEFVEVKIPIDESLLFLDNPDFLTPRAYNQFADNRSERIFLSVSEIRRSPDPDSIFVDALRHKELNYGFYY